VSLPTGDDLTADRPPDEGLLALVRDFLRDVERRQAEQVIDLPGGFAVLSPRYAASHDHNRLCLRSEIAAEDALRLADDVLGGAGLEHRLVVVDDDALGTAFAGPFQRAGYTHDIELVMVGRGAPARTTPRRSVPVEAVAADALHDMDLRAWRAALPDAPPDVLGQLVDRRRTRTLAAETVVFLAVRDPEGQVVARADLYLDATRGVAQIEDVMTDERHRNRGYAQALLDEATRCAGDAGCPTRFLFAAADDWPRILYGRLGYTVIGCRHLFARDA
jgi:GNAT superfamily N-acetyltransferase